ncbi:hypothetical protein [Atlantibacter hermannii]|uniref:hypothetical protein n=1 Tax=Atlantibacter hermannii TaxID=565 RepID=UPI0028A81B42|nr:hypothetical protein [Atlantibacter hermannii]
MTTDIINRFTEAKHKLAEAQAEHDTATTLQQAYTAEAFKRHLANPSIVTGYSEQTSPVSYLGRNFKEGTEKGWTLKAIRPVSQFAVVLVWQTEELSKKAGESRCKDLAAQDWQRHIEPVETRLSYAQYEYDQVSAEVAALKDVFSQVA